MSFNVSEVIQRKQSESPMRSYNWYIVLPDLTNGLNSPDAVYGDGVKDTLDLFSEASINHKLSTRITNISVPFSTVETEKENQGNSFWYYAKSNDIGQISFEMYEYEDNLTHNYIEAWQNLMFNSNGTYNAPVIYKRDIILYRLSSNKEQLVQHIYKNYFISGVADITNDYESNDIVKYAVNLTGDSVVYKHRIESGFVKGVGQVDSGFGDLGSVLSGLGIIAGKLPYASSL